MPRKKNEETTIATIPCAICGVQVAVVEYAAQVQTRHAPAPAAAPPAQPGGPPSYSPPQQTASVPGTSRPIPYTGPVNAKDFGSGNFLKGSDVPTGTKEVKVRALGFVTVPGSRSPLVLQIEKYLDRELMPLNKTNIKQVATFVGDDLRAVIGRVIVLMVYPVNNPQTGQMSRGLYVSRVE